MDGPWGEYIKWNKLERQIPYDFIYIWNFKKTKTKIMERTNWLLWEVKDGACEKWVKGIKGTNFQLKNNLSGDVMYSMVTIVNSTVLCIY